MTNNSSITLFALIAMLCGIADLVISHREKEAIRLALLQGWFFIDKTNPEGRLRRAATSILDAFDLIYGKRHWSWRCFGMSALLSAAFILMLALSFSEQIVDHYSNRPDYHYVVAASVMTATIYNIPTDYLFLLKARWILSYTRRIRPRFHFLLLLTDIATSIVFVAVGVTAIAIIAIAGGWAPTTVLNASAWDMAKELFKASTVYPIYSIHALVTGDHVHGGLPMFGLSFLSTFSTSAIFILYNVSAVLVAALAFFRIRLMNLLENLFNSKTLFTTIGLVCSGFILLARALFS